MTRERKRRSQTKTPKVLEALEAKASTNLALGLENVAEKQSRNEKHTIQPNNRPYQPIKYDFPFVRRALSSDISDKIVSALVKFLSTSSIEMVELPSTLSKSQRVLIHSFIEGLPKRDGFMTRSIGGKSARKLTVRRRTHQKSMASQGRTLLPIELPSTALNALSSFEDHYNNLLREIQKRQDSVTLASLIQGDLESSDSLAPANASVAQEQKSKRMVNGDEDDQDYEDEEDVEEDEFADVESKQKGQLSSLQKAEVIADVLREITGQSDKSELLENILSEVGVSDLSSLDSEETNEDGSGIVFTSFKIKPLKHDFGDFLASHGILQEELRRRSKINAVLREEDLNRPERASCPEDYIDKSTGKISYTKFPVCRIEDMPKAKPIPFMPKSASSRPDNLPIFAAQDHILRALEQHQVLIICADTGSGKSTQVPQFLMDYMTAKSTESQRSGLSTRSKGRIIVTQPRRIAAVSLAMRVSEERGENLLQAVENKPAKTINMQSKAEIERRISEVKQKLAFNQEGESKEELMEELVKLTLEEGSFDDQESFNDYDAQNESKAPKPTQNELIIKDTKNCEVGYMIRHEYATSENTRTVFMTIGLLLRFLCAYHNRLKECDLRNMLKYSPTDELYWSDVNSPLVSRMLRGLKDIQYLVIDEVHERGKLTDFLLALIRDVIKHRPDLKVILMSATIDAQMFSRYFGRAPIIQVPGRTHPVEVFHLHDTIEMTGYLGAGKKIVNFEEWVAFHEAMGNLPVSEDGPPLPHALLDLPENERVKKAIEYAKNSQKKILRKERECGLTINPPHVSENVGKQEFRQITRGMLRKTLEVLNRYTLRTRYIADAARGTHADRPDYELFTHLLMYITQPQGIGFRSILMPETGGNKKEVSGSKAFEKRRDEFESHTKSLSLKRKVLSVPLELIEEEALLPNAKKNEAKQKGNTNALPEEVQKQEIKQPDEDSGIVNRLRALIGLKKDENPMKARSTDMSSESLDLSPDLPHGEEAVSRDKLKQRVNSLGLQCIPDADDKTIAKHLLQFPNAKKLSKWREDDNAFEVGALIEPQGPVGKKPNMPHGAILVFCPTWVVIQEAHTAILDHPVLSDPSKYQVLTMHSSMSMEDQRQAFKIPPPGVWKIILSTNITETSVTVPDVVYVIDFGLVNQKSFNPETNMSSLLPTWVSQASAIQRTGRAGRVRPGLCFRMYSETRFNSMRPNILPEILNTNLDDIILYVKSLITPRSVSQTFSQIHSSSDSMQGLISQIQRRSMTGEAEAFLARTIEPPSPNAVSRALQRLHRLGGLDTNERLTMLGRFYSDMPLDSNLSRTILLSVILGCLDPVLIAVSASSAQQLFPMVPRNSEAAETQANARKRLAGEFESDDIVAINAFYEWSAADNPWQWARDNVISNSAIRAIARIRRQIFESLKSDRRLSARMQSLRLESGVMVSSSESNHANVNANRLHLVISVLAAGRYPNYAKITPGNAFAIREATGNPIPTRQSAVIDGLMTQPLYAYGEAMKISKDSTVLRTLTPLHPLAAAVFSPDLPNSREQEYQNRVKFLQQNVLGSSLDECNDANAPLTKVEFSNESSYVYPEDPVNRKAAAEFMGMEEGSTSTLENIDGQEEFFKKPVGPIYSDYLASLKKLETNAVIGSGINSNQNEQNSIVSGVLEVSNPSISNSTQKRYQIDIDIERMVEVRTRSEEHSKTPLGYRHNGFSRYLKLAMLDSIPGAKGERNAAYRDTLSSMGARNFLSPLPPLEIDSFLAIGSDFDCDLLPSQVRMLRSVIRFLLEEAVSQSQETPKELMSLSDNIGALINFLCSNRHSASIKLNSELEKASGNATITMIFAKGIVSIPSLQPKHAYEVSRATYMRGTFVPENVQHIPALLAEWARMVALSKIVVKQADIDAVSANLNRLLKSFVALLEPVIPNDLPWLSKSAQQGGRIGEKRANKVISGLLPDPFATVTSGIRERSTQLETHSEIVQNQQIAKEIIAAESEPAPSGSSNRIGVGLVATLSSELPMSRKLAIQEASIRPSIGTAQLTISMSARNGGVNSLSPLVSLPTLPLASANLNSSTNLPVLKPQRHVELAKPLASTPLPKTDNDISYLEKLLAEKHNEETALFERFKQQNDKDKKKITSLTNAITAVHQAERALLSEKDMLEERKLRVTIGGARTHMSKLLPVSKSTIVDEILARSAFNVNTEVNTLDQTGEKKEQRSEVATSTHTMKEAHVKELQELISMCIKRSIPRGTRAKLVASFSKRHNLEISAAMIYESLKSSSFDLSELQKTTNALSTMLCQIKLLKKENNDAMAKLSISKGRGDFDRICGSQSIEEKKEPKLDSLNKPEAGDALNSSPSQMIATEVAQLTAWYDRESVQIKQGLPTSLQGRLKDILVRIEFMKSHLKMVNDSKSEKENKANLQKIQKHVTGVRKLVQSFERAKTQKISGQSSSARVIQDETKVSPVNAQKDSNTEGKAMDSQRRELVANFLKAWPPARTALISNLSVELDFYYNVISLNQLHTEDNRVYNELAALVQSDNVKGQERLKKVFTYISELHKCELALSKALIQISDMQPDDPNYEIIKTKIHNVIRNLPHLLNKTQEALTVLSQS